jgi:hypothetical protein
MASELPASLHPMGKIHRHVPRIHSSDLLAIVDERGFGIGSSEIGPLLNAAPFGSDVAFQHCERNFPELINSGLSNTASALPKTFYHVIVSYQ